MIEIILIILPVFLLVGTGFACARLGYLDAGLSDALNAYAVKLAVPVLLFSAMLRLDLSAAYHPPMLIAFYAGAFVCFAVAIVLARTVWQRRAGESVAVGFAAMFSNTLLLGLPIMQRAYGEESLAPVFGIISLHAPVLYIVGIVTMELSRRDGRPLGETLAAAMRSLLTNALMIGIAAGLCLNLVGVDLPEPVSAAVAMIATSAIPVSLVGIGAALTRYQLKAELAESLMVAVLALILHPALVLVLTQYVLGLPADHVRAAVVLAAMPPGMNIYIFAVMYDRAVALSASAMIVATCASVITIVLWLALLRHLLPV